MKMFLKLSIKTSFRTFTLTVLLKKFTACANVVVKLMT